MSESTKGKRQKAKGEPQPFSIFHFPFSRDQRGMASILVTMITLIVISLIVLGFATISRREQNNTVDQQLSTQAFYAAESAVNDVRNVVNSAAGTIPAKTNCTSGPTAYRPVPQWLNSPQDSVGYTCLLVNPEPGNLIHDSVGDNSWVVPVTPANGPTPIDHIQIQWTPASTTPGSPATCPNTLNRSFKSSTNWNCAYGLVRMDLVPTEGTLTKLDSSLLTGFFEPQRSANPGSSLDYSATGKANIVAADCVPSYQKCTTTITGLSATSYTLRLNSFYRTSNITVTAYDSHNQVIDLNAQVMVDATGVANGVLRRIQVRIPVDDYNGNIPGYAIQSNGSICKRFSVTPTYFDIASGLPTSNPDSSYPLCRQNGPDGTP